MNSASPVAEARRLAAAGQRRDAEAGIARLVTENFGLPVSRVTLNYDWTSLNSLNGTVDTGEGSYFFKLHHEEGEEATVSEYYRGELLKRHGYDVDVPLKLCREPGRQILLYPVRREVTLAAALLAMERGGDTADAGAIVKAQRDLDAKIGRIYLRTLHRVDQSAVEAEPIHQLFHSRLCDVDRPRVLGGRAARFYFERNVPVAGTHVGWEEFSQLRWTVNGISYRDSLDEIFRNALHLLAPAALVPFGQVVAHGDAHNANVWLERHDGETRLVMFDPAFAGEHVPSILAEVKATFHNIFAHPFWLYHPLEAERRFTVVARRRGKNIEIEHDWRLERWRRDFLDAKRDLVWRPLLAAMKANGMLPSTWRQTLRAGFFACPTLVLNLLGEGTLRPESIMLLSFALAVGAGSEPQAGAQDIFSSFLDEVSP